MKKTTLMFFWIACPWLLGSCVTDSPKSVGFQPLAVGNEWHYADSLVTSGPASGETLTRTVRIAGTMQVTYQGQSNTVFLEQDGRDADSVYWLYGNEGGSLYTYGGKSGDSLYLLGKALSFGPEGWKVVYSSSNGEFFFDTNAANSAAQSWVSADSVYTTPAGAFHCYVGILTIRLGSDSASTTFFWDPQVGEIASIYRNNGTVTERSVLTSYTLH